VSRGYFSLGCALLIIAGFGFYFVMRLFLADTATREFKITKTGESPNSENVSIDDNFIYDEENNICDVCYMLFKRVKEKDIIKVGGHTENEGKYQKYPVFIGQPIELIQYLWRELLLNR
jgi:hypothetical protein